MTPYKDPEKDRERKRKARAKAREEKRLAELDILALRHIKYDSYVWACEVLERDPINEQAWKKMREENQDHPDYRHPRRKR